MRFTTEVYVIKMTLQEGSTGYVYIAADGSIGRYTSWIFASKWLNEYSALQAAEELKQQVTDITSLEVERHIGPRID